jgi:hypothetical protein
LLFWSGMPQVPAGILPEAQAFADTVIFLAGYL